MINNAYKEVHQATIYKTCQCTPEYTCKLLKELTRKGIIVKNYRNSILVRDPLTLSFVLGFEKNRTQPLMFKAPDFKDLLETLNQTIYSLTLNSALQVKQGRTPMKTQAYILGKDVEMINSNFRRVYKNPDLIVYPSDYFCFLKQQLHNNIFLVTDNDLFVDLINHSSVNKALSFAKKYKLFKTNSF